MQDIKNEILRLSTLIEKDYPELYQYLDETLIATPFIEIPDIQAKIMKDYLESLNLLLAHYIETHKTKPG